MKNTTTKLRIGEDIILQPGEKLHTFKNKITGEILYSTTSNLFTIVDGVLFIKTFPKPTLKNVRRENLTKLDALERIRSE